jgi:hypothetical protein
VRHTLERPFCAGQLRSVLFDGKPPGSVITKVAESSALQVGPARALVRLDAASRPFPNTCHRLFGDPAGTHWEAAAYELQDFIGECRAPRIPVAIALFPHLSAGLPAGAYEFAELHDQVLELSARSRSRASTCARRSRPTGTTRASGPTGSIRIRTRWRTGSRWSGSWRSSDRSGWTAGALGRTAPPPAATARSPLSRDAARGSAGSRSRRW